MGNSSSRVPEAPPLFVPSMNGEIDEVNNIIKKFKEECPDAEKLKEFVNMQDAEGNGAIHGAAFNGHLEIVEFLDSCGSDLDLQNNLGCSPLWLAAGYNHSEVLSYLLQRVDNPRESLMTTNKSGDSPLLAAASRGHEEICVQLLEKARELKMENVLKCFPNNSGDTAFSVAIAGGFGDNESLYDLLFDELILDKSNTKGLTPLLIACERDWPDLAKKMIDSGSVPHLMTDGTGATPLAVAAFCGCDSVLGEVFLAEKEKYKKILDKPNNSGCTPLWLAVRAGHVECVKLLLQSGANRELAGGSGTEKLTPLEAAKKYERQEIVDVILSTGNDT